MPDYRARIDNYKAPLLSFKPAPKKSGLYCPKYTSGYNEDGCGTKRFCQAIGIFDSSSDKFTEKPQWDTAEACFEAHEQEPEQNQLPFHVGLDPSDCGQRAMGIYEKLCGTGLYCQKIDELGSEAVELLEDICWNSTKECLDAHVAEPKDLLSWKEPDTSSFCGHRGDYSEDNCGTEQYCALFKESIRTIIPHVSPYIWTEEQCLAHHAKNPGAITFLDN